MAALPDDEKKQATVEFKSDPLPTWSDQDIKSLTKASQKLLKHKCKYTLDKNNKNLTFMPSPHLYDKDGNYTRSKDKSLQDENNFMTHEKYEATVSIDDACSFAAGSLDCDAIEATFIDENAGKYNNVKLVEIGSKWVFSNAFIKSCFIAWAQHYPLKIEPSHIWLCILQSVALHVDENAEKLREKWVMHDGKKKLTVIRNEFIKGSQVDFFVCCCCCWFHTFPLNNL